jgi:DNA-3-methyladenine glycosylase II
VAAVKDLAEKSLAGEIPTRRAAEKLSDAALVECLTNVRGIGTWTVEMFLIFTLGRPDVLPLDDYGVRKGFARTFGRDVLPKPKELATLGEKWRPFRTAASWYLWRALELDTRH